MGGRMIRSFVAIAAAAVLAGTIGTAVYAMVQDDSDPVPVGTNRQSDDSLGFPAPTGDGGVAAICLEGATDCQDMVVDEDGGAAGGTCLEGATECVDNPSDFQQCATEERCGDFQDACPPDTSCIEPWLMNPPVCPDGVSIDECFPDGIPAGYECLVLETFPEQIKCYRVGCLPVDGGPVTTLPAPDTGTQAGEPQVDPAPEVQEEPVPPTAACPPEECAEDADGVMHCKPIDDPCSPEPDPNVRCLPPDCSVSSDGSVDCPVPLPEPCSLPGDEPSDFKPCEVPPSGGSGCAPELTPEECARTDPPVEGGGSDGAASSEGGAVAVE